MPGFNLELLVNREELDDSFRCSICKLLLKEPWQLNDGRRVCASCLEDQNATEVENSEPPKVNTRDLIRRKKGCFYDRFAWKYIKSLDVICEYEANGCDWVGKVSELEDHVVMCDKKVSVKNGSNTQYCSKEDDKENFRPTETCRNAPLQLQKLENTCKIWCDNSEKICPFSEEGCNHNEVMNTNELHDHIELSLIGHLLLLLSSIKNIRFSVDVFLKTFAAFKNDIHNRVDQVGAFVSEIESKVVKWTEYIKTNIASIWEKIEHICKDISDIKNTLQHMNVKSNEKDVIIEMDSKMFAQQTQIGEQMIAMNQMHKSLENCNDRLAALRGAYYDLKASQKVQEAPEALLSLPAPISPPVASPDHLVSYDGVLLWKVTNVMKKRQEAIMKKVPSILSPAFYTSFRGYKLCARLYMNGDGEWQGKYMSLFVAVMKGPYDAVLSWPFKHKVNMTLIDQDNIKNHEESFTPDPGSKSFQRPTKDINIASGSAQYFALDALDLNGYLRDDTLFIKITVGV